MEEAPSNRPSTRHTPGWAQLRMWQLALVVLFLAIALADIKDQRIREPVLVILAVGGRVLYGLIGWMGWWGVRRFEKRLGVALLFSVYSVAMGVLFLIATIIYLIIAHVYRVGRL
jgi:xanthine/uracil permease